MRSGGLRIPYASRGSDLWGEGVVGGRNIQFRERGVDETFAAGVISEVRENRDISY